MARHVMLPSPSMGRSMHVWTYGHFGPPVIVFPTAAGFAHEWQAQGMIDTLAPLLGSGRMKLYCPESNVAEAWTRREGSLAWRMSRHRAYEQFVLDTLVPFVRADCHSPNIPITAVGCSLGATYAANMALKYPHVFHDAVCMSGRYLVTEITHGETNQDVYFNNPLAYVPNLGGGALDHVRRNTRLTLVCGRGRYEEGCIEETIALADVLEHKRIPHVRDIWGTDSVHDWAWWKKQTVHHLGQRF
jgi:esterase/lipase superfamily enzyme